jgi:hypothetical protein
MSASWRAVGEFVLLKKDNQENEMGLIIDTHYCVKSIGDTVPLRLNRNDMVVVNDGATITPLTPSNRLNLFIVHYKDLVARDVAEELSYVGDAMHDDFI